MERLLGAGQVMVFEGAEEDGAIHILLTVTSRKKLHRTLKEIQFIDPNAMNTVEDLRMAKIPPALAR